MLRYRSTLSSLVLALVAVALIGCGFSEYRKQETYYLVATNVNIPYWQAAKAGLLEAATEIGVSADMVGPNSYDPQAERQAFEDLLHQKVLPSGIMISVAEPAVLKDVIDEAIAKGINVITIDSDAISGSATPRPSRSSAPSRPRPRATRRSATS